MPILSLKIKNAVLVHKGLEHLRKAIPEISRQRLYDAAAEIRDAMKEAGIEPTYPIHWDSVKQRKAFFASDGFTKPRDWKRPKGYVNTSIPYKRKGTYEKAWKIEKSPAGKAPASEGYHLVNALEYAKYIGGTARGARQSRIHKGRWNVFRKVADRIIAKLPKTVIRSLQIIARKEGFKTK